MGPRFFVSGRFWGAILDFWQVFPAALALVLIIEGLMPFISPNHWRNMLALVAQMDDRVIRRIGFGSMMLGVILLYLVN
ncbi:DUF2065 domain-containing protein [Pseudohalioglobus sediminis]|uniref:DUF2065 domain-containing protein n=1 Tax=Pseudohalioglobus sediminis TaxID=2606449 RepID=A0A5B0WPU7_9GAMM|nr:DUF2065 domain-containing protein [Pseudohalioglobus sediminis]